MGEMTPQNGSYMVAGYVATAVVLFCYAISLWVRSIRVRRK